MRSDSDQFSVTVRRINDGLRDPPYENLTAQSVTLTASGTLFVDGKINGKTHLRTFSLSVWGSFEVKRIRAEARAGLGNLDGVISGFSA
ncbi:hypothetical protein SAMN05519104_8188 [Rhizobiales bacterium GAS188]|nr:hypothetical protein SAMN05519104_8188 [Rhizobiales bacterium GAS188]